MALEYEAAHLSCNYHNILGYHIHKILGFGSVT